MQPVVLERDVVADSDASCGAFTQCEVGLCVVGDVDPPGVNELVARLTGREENALCDLSWGRRGGAGPGGAGSVEGGGIGGAMTVALTRLPCNHLQSTRT